MASESDPWNEGWKRLEPGYVVDRPLLASPWEWGRTVMTGAMAEHEELAEIKPRLASVEEQVAGLPALVNVMLAEAESRIRVEVEAGFKRSDCSNILERD